MSVSTPVRVVRLELPRPDGGWLRIVEVGGGPETYAVAERVTEAGEVRSALAWKAEELDRVNDTLTGIRCRALGAPVRGELAERVQAAAGLRSRRTGGRK